MTDGQKIYISELQRCLKHLESQSNVFSSVCEEIYRSIKSGGVFHIFGSGHSVMVTEELFHRAGGLVPINPIFEANDYRLGEVLILVSNSGINASTVELAAAANKAGLMSVSMTSLTHSKSVPSRSGKKLYEITKFVIDTETPVGDACISISSTD